MESTTVSQTNLSAVIGNSLILFPVASYTAFAIAAATPTIPISPKPFALIGVRISSDLIKSTSIWNLFKKRLFEWKQLLEEKYRLSVVILGINIIKMIAKHRQEIVEKITKAITQKKIVEFTYIAKDVETVRKVEPYLLGVNKKGSLFVSGYFTATQEQLEKKMKSGHKNFLVDNIMPESLKVLREKFDSLKVEDTDKIYFTKETTVLSVVYFPEIVSKDYTSPSIEIKEKNLNKAKIFKLPQKEQVQLAEELWSKVEAELMPITDEDVVFAEERLQMHQANLSEGVSLEEFKSYFSNKYGF